MIAWGYRVCRNCQEVADPSRQDRNCAFCGTWIGTGDDLEDAGETAVDARRPRRRRRKSNGGRYTSA